MAHDRILFDRNPDATRDENIYSGVVSLIVVFLVLGLLVMPNGEYVLVTMVMALFRAEKKIAFNS